MRISDLLVMCVRNLTRRKLRTILTLIGVVIGTCMIIVMVSLVEGTQRRIDEMFSNFGDLTIIQVWPSWSGDGMTVLDDDALTQIAMIPGVAAVTPFDRVRTNLEVFAGRNERYKMDYMTLVGVYPEALEQLGYRTAEGRMIQSQQSSRGGVELLFGSLMAFNFQDTRRRWPNNQVWEGVDEFGNENVPFIDPLTETLTLRMRGWGQTEKPVDFEASVVGILQGGGSNEWETMYNAFIDIREMRKMQEEYNKENKTPRDRNEQPESYENVRVKASSIRQVVAVQERIDEMGHSTHSMESTRKQMEDENRQLQIIMGAIGGITLLVAVISIANTMIMSVYERTREIGVMKVLGCLIPDIRKVFLFEAGMIGFFGGVLGVGLSYVLSFIINHIGGNIGGMFGGGGGWGWGMDQSMNASIIAPWMLVMGLGFATIIGVAAGFYPAHRAVRISALEAIKNE